MGALQTGGSVDISAGSGSHGHGGAGGSVRVTGGRAGGYMLPKTYGPGGDIQLVSGAANKGVGGSVLVQSGFSEGASSGSIGKLIMFSNLCYSTTSICTTILRALSCLFLTTDTFPQ